MTKGNPSTENPIKRPSKQTESQVVPVEAIRKAAQLIRSARRVVVLTGAGVSTPSGIPDFRSAGSGLWTRFLPMEVASLTVFRTKPETFFAWLRPLASHMLGANPNPAHLALARLEEAGYIQTIITQNIDGLHHRAGSKSVLEIHGTFNTLTCGSCYHTFPSKDFIQPYLETGAIPRCSICNGVLKPDIILFEEQLPLKIWKKAEKASENCDLMLVAGTSLEVMPSAGLPLKAIEHGARLIIINHMPTYIDVRADLVFHQDVAEVIPLIAEEILGG
jgi:NAD-dependent deacetylase